MKRKLILGLATLFITTGWIQAQTQLGVKAGYNAANMSNKDGSVSDAKMLSTFNAGLVADVGIADLISVRTGIDLQSKGWKYTFGGTDYSSNPMYLEVPVNLTLNLPIGPVGKLYIGAGPYFAYGVAGKVKVTSGSSSNTTKINFTKDQTLASFIPGKEYKPFDMGANIVGGVTFNNRFGINAQYGMGLMNTVPESSNNNKGNRHRVLGISGIVYF